MRLKNLWELMLLRVVLAGRVMLIKTTLESIMKQRQRHMLLSRVMNQRGSTAEDPLPHLPSSDYKPAAHGR